MDFLYPQNVQQVQRGIMSECNCIYISQVKCNFVLRFLLALPYGNTVFFVIENCFL
jgi:hypothetical protein